MYSRTSFDWAKMSLNATTNSVQNSSNEAVQFCSAEFEQNAWSTILQLRYRGLNNMANIFQTTFFMHFLVRKVCILIPIALHFNNPTCLINNETELLQMQFPRKACLIQIPIFSLEPKCFRVTVLNKIWVFHQFPFSVVTELWRCDTWVCMYVTWIRHQSIRGAHLTKSSLSSHLFLPSLEDGISTMGLMPDT